MPGKALAVAMAILYMRGITKSEKDIVVGDKLGESFGIGRKARTRCLASLEKEGLITVDRHPGRCPRATVLEVNGES